MRFALPAASAWSWATAAAASAARAGSASRESRHAATAFVACSSTSGSTVWTAAARSAVNGLGSVVVNRLTPTTTCSPDSIRSRWRACASTSAALR